MSCLPLRTPWLWRIVLAFAAATKKNPVMRFAVAAGGVALASFFAGYGSRRDAPPAAGAMPKSREVSGGSPLHEVPPPEPGTSSRPRSVPDLLEALQPSVDPIAQGERILAAIDALDAAGIAALLTPPRSTELQRLSEESLWRWRGAILGRVMNRWLDLDPAAARAWLPGAAACFPSAIKGYLDVCAVHLLDPVAERFPEDAVAFALAAPPGRMSKDAARYVIQTIAAKNPARARELADRFTTEETRKEALEGYWRGFAKADAVAALGQATASGEKYARATVLHSLDLESWNPRRVDEFGQLLEPKEWVDLAERYARVNPAGAARLVGQFVSRTDAEHLPVQAEWLIASWFGRSDGERGIEWAQGLPEKVRASALRSVAEYWAAADPAAVVARLGELLPEGSERTGAFVGAMRPWIGHDPDAALAWVDALPPGELRAAVERAAIENLASNDRAEEALARLSQLAPSATGDIYTYAATQNLADRNPRRLVEWSLYFAGTGHSFPSVGSVVAGWFARDPATAIPWVTALPAGAARDEAAAQCAAVASRADEAAAVEWLGWVADPTRRKSAAETVAQVWAERDPQAAQAWREQFHKSSPP